MSKRSGSMRMLRNVLAVTALCTTTYQKEISVLAAPFMCKASDCVESCGPDKYAKPTAYRLAGKECILCEAKVSESKAWLNHAFGSSAPRDRTPKKNCGDCPFGTYAYGGNMYECLDLKTGSSAQKNCNDYWGWSVHQILPPDESGIGFRGLEQTCRPCAEAPESEAACVAAREKAATEKKITEEKTVVEPVEKQQPVESQTPAPATATEESHEYCEQRGCILGANLVKFPNLSELYKCMQVEKNNSCGEWVKFNDSEDSCAKKFTTGYVRHMTGLFEGYCKSYTGGWTAADHDSELSKFCDEPSHQLVDPSTGVSRVYDATRETLLQTVFCKSMAGAAPVAPSPGFPYKFWTRYETDPTLAGSNSNIDYKHGANKNAIISLNSKYSSDYAEREFQQALKLENEIIEEAKLLALELGLNIGGKNGFAFAGNYYTKGLYAYSEGTYKGYAFFGRGGNSEQQQASPAHPKYRPGRSATTLTVVAPPLSAAPLLAAPLSAAPSSAAPRSQPSDATQKKDDETLRLDHLEKTIYVLIAIVALLLLLVPIAVVGYHLFGRSKPTEEKPTIDSLKRACADMKCADQITKMDVEMGSR